MKLKHYFTNRTISLSADYGISDRRTYIFTTLKFKGSYKESITYYNNELGEDDPEGMFMNLLHKDPIHKLDMQFIKEIIDEAVAPRHRDST